MKIREYKFRQLENKLFYISGEGITGFDELRSQLPGGELTEGVLVYGYVEHELGIMFQVLCGVQKSGTVLLFLDANTRPDMNLTYGQVADCEAEPMAKEEVDFSRYMHLTRGIEMRVKMAGREGALAKLARLNERLDPARTEENPDVLRVTVKKSGAPEAQCLLRCERAQGDAGTGTVVSAPPAELGISQGARLEFTVQDTTDSIELVCQL